MVCHFRIHEEDNGYWAESVELPGCRTEADSMEELARNAEEALNLYLEEPEHSTVSFPLPETFPAQDTIAVQVDPQVALSVLLRNYRTQRQYTQREVAEKLGLKNTYSCQRLERRSNPNQSTTFFRSSRFRISCQAETGVDGAVYHLLVAVLNYRFPLIE
ncbi:MAG: type II toxin-antitoxin system HicB family antitoxin [bacterium]